MTSRFARRLATAALCGAFALSACSSDEERLARHLESAREYEAQGQNREALLELRSALQLDPKNADVNFRIAELLAEEGRFADAAFHYRETTRLDPRRSEAALAEAKLILFEDTDRAEELVEQVIEREPGNALAQLRRSEIALARGDADGALEAALTGVELDPQNGLMHMQLGIVHQARIRRHRVLREEVPEKIFEDAARAFRRADELLGGGPSARVELGRLYAIWPGREQEAAEAFRGAMEVAEAGEPRGRAAGAAISYARAVGDEELLHESLEQMVANVPTNLPAWDELAALEERAEPGRGDAVYRRLLELRPDDSEAHVRFARFMVRNERFDAAIAHLESLADGRHHAAVALAEISGLRLGRGDLEGARAALDRLLREHANHPRTALASGRVALAEGRVDEAVESLRRYVASEESAEGQRLLAIAELRRRNHPAAISAVDAAIALEPGSDIELLRLKSTILEAAGDWQQVFLTMRRLAREPGLVPQPADQLRFARSLYETGRERMGKAVLEQLLAEESPPPQAYLEYALREGERDPERAREYLEQVLEQAPGYEPALRRLVIQLVEEDRFDDALAAIDRAAEARPLTPPLLLLRAEVLAARQDWPAAEEEARRAFAAAPNMTPALDLLARIYTAQGRLDEAIRSFQEAEQVGALPPSGQVLLARLHLAAGQHEQARPLYEKALQQRNDLPGAKNDLAWLLADAGQDLERAQKLAQEAQRAEPENPDFVDTLGFVYLRRGLYEPAVQQLEYAVDLADRAQLARPEFHYHLGLALRALGRQGDAAAAFERALALDAEFPHAEEARRELEAARSSSASTPG